MDLLFRTRTCLYQNFPNLSLFIFLQARYYLIKPNYTR